jgi:hypothetical protein
MAATQRRLHCNMAAHQSMPDQRLAPSPRRLGKCMRSVARGVSERLRRRLDNLNLLCTAHLVSWVRAVPLPKQVEQWESRPHYASLCRRFFRRPSRGRQLGLKLKIRWLLSCFSVPNGMHTSVQYWHVMLGDASVSKVGSMRLLTPDLPSNGTAVALT